jgi:hypothetical protein
MDYNRYGGQFLSVFAQVILLPHAYKRRRKGRALLPKNVSLQA